MSTQAQIAANRANAQHSTGPRTADGKAASSQNRYKFSLTGEFRVLPWEFEQEFKDLLAKLMLAYQPGSPFEQELVRKMAEHYWTSRRALKLQAMCAYDENVMIAEPSLKQLALYMRYQINHDRAFDRCARELRNLQKARQNEQIGFESQKRREAEEARKQAEAARKESAEKRKQELHKWAVLHAEARLDHQTTLTSSVRRAMAPADHAENHPKAIEKAA